MALKKWYIILCMVGSLWWVAALAQAMENDDCLGCHGDSFITEGGKAHLYIEGEQFSKTSHADVGCTSCHSSVTEDHPDDGVKPSKASCEECHPDIQETYAQSKHAENAACADCHDPHAVKSHHALSGFDENRICTTCHDRAATYTSHDGWLPRTDLHLRAVPCISCHTVTDEYDITLYIERGPRDERAVAVNLASHDELSEMAGGKDVSTLIDEDGDGLISLTELRAFNTSDAYKDLRLWGMMTSEAMVHRYDILDNRWDCTFCHASGSDAMQTSYVAFPKADGTYERMAVEKGAVLDALFGTPDFYMLGATRNDVLSILGLAIVAGGMMVPVVHGTLRYLTRKNRRHH